MVKTSESIMDLNASHRIVHLEDIAMQKTTTIHSKKKELEEYEKSKKKEIEELDNKKKKQLEELESKRKEIEEIESKSKKDLENARRLIDHSLQDVIRHKRILSDEEDTRKRSLDSIADVDAQSKGKNIEYGKFFEELSAPQKVYNVTNHNFYENLSNLRDKAATGEITPEEQAFVANLRERFDQFNNNKTYREKDSNHYIQRSINLISQIDNYNRMKE